METWFVFLEGQWVTENGWSCGLAAKWDCSRYSDSLKPADAQVGYCCLTMKLSEMMKGWENRALRGQGGGVGLWFDSEQGEELQAFNRTARISTKSFILICQALCAWTAVLLSSVSCWPEWNSYQGWVWLHVAVRCAGSNEGFLNLEREKNVSSRTC